MDDALRVACEMHERLWDSLKDALEDLGGEERDWRPLPEANSIALIVRHLAIEAEWHRAALERGQPMPHETTADLQREIDAVPFDFDENVKSLERSFAGFLSTLKGITLADLEQRSKEAYARWPSRQPHYLGFHQAIHLAMHLGQIRTIRNLYRRTRGEPSRFFPENPTYPSSPR